MQDGWKQIFSFTALKLFKISFYCICKFSVSCCARCSLSLAGGLPVRRLTVNLFSRKIPGLNVYAQMQNEKEQEMKSPANPTEASAGSQRDLVHSLEILDTEFSSRPIGEDPTPPHLTHPNLG